MFEGVLSIAGATMAFFGLFVLVDLGFSGYLKTEHQKLVNLLVFVALGIVSLTYHTEIRPGVVVDARGAAVASATVFGGALPGALVAAAAAGYRLILGGAGAWAGVAGLAADFFLVLGAVRLLSRRGVVWQKSLWTFVFAGLAAALGEASSLLLVPPRSRALELFLNMGPSLAIVQLLTTILIGGLGKLLWERRREARQASLMAWRYELLSRYSNDAVLLADDKGRILEANPALCTLTGFTHAELIGMSVQSLTADSGELAGGIGGTHSFESRWRRKDGTLVEVEVSISADSDANEPSFAFVRDIGERKRAEQALLESESRYRLLAEHSTDVIWMLDLATLRFTYVSPSVFQLRGYTPEEVMAQPMADALTPEAARAVSELLPRRLAALAAGDESARTGVTEIPQPRKDGTIVETEVVTTFVNGPDGKVSGVVGVTREITERKRSEEELRIKEAALASSSAGIVIATLEGRIAFANAAFLSMWGFETESEVLGTSVGEYWLDSADAMRVAGAVLEKGHWQGELLARRKDGSTFDASVLANRVDAGDGHPIRILGSFTDVTESRRISEELKRQKERLERASQFGRIVLWEADLATRTLETSGHADPLLPLQPGQPFTMDDFLSLVHPNDLLAVTSAMAAHLSGGAPLDQEFRLRRVDGTYSWVHDAGAALRDEKGRPYRLLGAMSDVTALKEAEAALKVNQTRLEETQALANLGSWSLDLRTMHLEWSPEVFRILEVAGNEPDYNAYLAAFHPEERDALMAKSLQQVAAGGSGDVDRRLLMKDGRIKWVRERYRVECAPDGTPLRSSGTIQDITDHVLARETRQMAEAKEAAEAANRAKSAFLASMSHEIRTPMNAILGFSQLLMSDAGLNGQQKEQLEAIYRSGEHLLGLINDVLEMSKIEAGRVTVNPGETDLLNLLWDLESMFRLKAEGKGLYLHVNRADGLPRHIVTDEVKLRQILINLLGNAVKFTAEGGVKVRVFMEPEAGEVLRLFVSVEDSGPGIAEEDLPRLFQRFEQTRTGREASSGTGLGLAISRGFARLMGGDISVSSRPGEGSLFTLSLPVTRVAAPAIKEREVPRQITGLKAGQATRRILVTDDVADNREVLRRMLSRVGFDVQTAKDGGEALKLRESWHPDLILMDIQMPGMSGLDVTRTIRIAEGSGQRIPIIAVTANAFDEDRRQAEDAGCDGFVSKPFKETELLQLAGRFLGVEYILECETKGTSSRVPGPLRAALRSAVISADLDRVFELEGELAATEPEAARTVRDLAERFEYAQLLAYLDEGA